MNPLLLIPQVAKAAEHPAVHAMDIQLGKNTEETTYAIARWILEGVHWLLDLVGLSHHPALVTTVYAVIVFLIAVLVGRAVQWVVVQILNKIGPHLHSDFYSYLVKERFFTRLCRIIPALVFLIMIQFTMTDKASLAAWLTRLTWIYFLLVITDALCTLTDSIWSNVNTRANKKHLPLNGIVQLVKLILWIISVIIICAILLDKSPGSLLAGLGAFAAVLMLVFKDSILGVVAGVQLAQNDSLHVGDWIAVPGSDTNGTVTEVGLTAVKVENWDKTTSTLPPYSLVSKGLKNYRSMSQSNTRRIQRSYFIDADSVVPLTDEMLAEYAKIPLLKDWIALKLEERAKGIIPSVNSDNGPQIGSIDTNLGLFRAYMTFWLNSNPDISHQDTCFVTTLEQTSTGIPLQLYCFTATSSWLPYEGVQAAVFEHVAVMLYKFRLYTFEYASGRDSIIEGYLSPGKNPGSIFGMPYPFFPGSGTPTNPGNPPAGMYPPTPGAPTSAPSSAPAGPSDAGQTPAPSGPTGPTA